MVTKFKPKAHKVYLINQYTMIHILEGTGGIEVDFKSFHDWADKLIFLEKGQYVKFLNEGFIARKIEFEDLQIFRNKDFRVLFKHLISLGYINFDACSDCQKYLGDSILSQPTEILDISSQQWYWQNPFNVDKSEYHIIFDVKEIIDQQFKNHLSNQKIIELLGKYELNAQAIYTQKVGITVKNLLGNKRLLESKKEVAFTDKSIKEIAYEFGYKDPAYFNRIFKQNTGLSPQQFRDSMPYEERDKFIQELYELIQQFHAQERNLNFYAEKMHLSVKTLSKKVKDRLQLPISQLIRQEIIKSSKKLLAEGQTIHEVAFQLNFEEANHFSAFFKHHTQMNPSEFQLKKYKK